VAKQHGAAKGTFLCCACGKRRAVKDADGTKMLGHVRRPGSAHRDPICVPCLLMTKDDRFSPFIQGAIRTAVESPGVD